MGREGETQDAEEEMKVIFMLRPSDVFWVLLIAFCVVAAVVWHTINGIEKLIKRIRGKDEREDGKSDASVVRSGAHEEEAKGDPEGPPDGEEPR